MNEDNYQTTERTPDTTRRRLNRIRRVTAFLIIAGSLTFFAGLICVFSESFPSLDVLAVGAASNALGLIIRAFVGRCGHCRRRLSRALAFGGWPWSVSRHVRFCPYCAASVDEPLPQARNA